MTTMRVSPSILLLLLIVLLCDECSGFGMLSHRTFGNGHKALHMIIPTQKYGPSCSGHNHNPHSHKSNHIHSHHNGNNNNNNNINIGGMGIDLRGMGVLKNTASCSSSRIYAMSNSNDNINTGGSKRASSNLQSAVMDDLDSIIDGNLKTYDRLQKYPCLILNSDYRPLSHLPLSLWNWQDSLRAIFSGRAIMVAAYDITVRSVSDEYELPSIIALKQYHRTPTNHAPTMSRKGIFLRDDYVCQYCDTRFPSEKLSLDHLVPRSRGGKLTWTNTVTACHQCNFAKGANGPAELKKIGMKLKSKPRVPSTAELQAKSRKLKKFKVSCEDWHDYI